jgi:hypothetical protein
VVCWPSDNIYLSAEAYARLQRSGLELTRQRLGDWR